ncbi:fungal-specific transcription factor domain-containing protein [Diaporthe sp. PMI_573]|nr:fungal-specific transcription factor domain-containing protein [Diaporthaceae sp. PMI_573]
MLVRSSAGNDSSDGSPQAPRTRQQPGAACDECRRRKLRCDRQRPRCGACQTSGATCVIPATKPARGPKRGYLKTLQARISALEGAVGNQPCVLSNPPSAGDVSNTSLDMGEIPDFTDLGDISGMDLDQLAWPLGISEEGPQTPANTDESSSPGCSSDVTIPSLVQADLDQLYMDRIHMFIPILHHGRCVEWAKSEPGTMSEVQTALRNAMWTLSASASAYHLTLRDSLYQRARQALENLDQPADTEVVQAWLLLAVYELMCVSFRRAWITAGRAFRLIQLDSAWTEADGGVPTEMISGNQHHQAKWIEIEQRRRTFWFAYCLDRLMSLRNGSPPTFGERVSVRLPCPEAAFQYGQPVPMGFLSERKATAIASTPNGPTMVPSSTFHECIMAATVAGHALSHRRQAVMDIAAERNTTNARTPHGIFAFWDRHAWLDSLVSDSMSSFAAHHPPAAQERDPMLMFLAMAWRAIVLYLWHTAEGIPAPAPAQDHDVTHAMGLDPSSSAQMSDRAAQEVLRLMGKMSELNSWKVHPLMSIPLTLCAELLAPRPDLMAAFSQKLNEIMQAAHSLGPLSGAEMRAYQ